MGVWDRVSDLFRAAERYTDVSLSAPGRAGVYAQPGSWAQRGELTQVVWGDIFGAEADRMRLPVTQAEALRVPAVARGRAVLQSLLGGRPLRALNAAGPLTDQPTWLYRSDSGVSPQLRMSLILDDMIFHEASLLVVERGAQPSNGGLAPILDAVHCPRERWDVDPADGTLLVDDQPVPPGAVVWIPGPSSGLLREAADTIRAARDMTRAWAQRVRTPVPSLLLKELEQNGMTDAEIDDMLSKVATARRSGDGAVMFIPAGVEAVPLNPSDDAALFENGRNALRIDIANFMNFPAGVLDGSPNTASLTYDTRQGMRNALQDYTLPYYYQPIENALSQDDVTPRGTRIRFDFTDLDAATNAPFGANEED